MYEYNHEGVMKAETSLALLVSGTCQYPLRTSILLTNVGEPTRSMQYEEVDTDQV